MPDNKKIVFGTSKPNGLPCFFSINTYAQIVNSETVNTGSSVFLKNAFLQIANSEITPTGIFLSIIHKYHLRPCAKSYRQSAFPEAAGYIQLYGVIIIIKTVRHALSGKPVLSQHIGFNTEGKLHLTAVGVTCQHKSLKIKPVTRFLKVKQQIRVMHKHYFLIAAALAQGIKCLPCTFFVKAGSVFEAAKSHLFSETP